MKILTTKTQREIERYRNIIYKYLRENPTDNLEELSNAVEALVDISCECGVWSNPSSWGT